MDVDPFVLEIDGLFSFEARLILHRQMVIRGGGPGLSMLSWSTMSAGMHVLSSAGFSRLSGLVLTSPHMEVPGLVGIEINGPACHLSDVRLDAWGRHGLAVIGELSVGTNANGGQFVGVMARLCGHGGAKNAPDLRGAGFYFDGADANGNTVIGARAYDCRKGFLDSSFIGNSFIGAAAEGCSNKEDAGWTPQASVGCGYETDDPACFSSFVDCYAEGDSCGRVNSPATIYGGTLAAHNVGTAISVGAAGAYGRFPTVRYGEGRVIRTTLGGGGPGVALSIAVDKMDGSPVILPTSLRYDEDAIGWWSWNHAGIDRLDSMRFRADEAWFANGFFLGRNGQSRGVRVQVVPSLAAALTYSIAWAVGDRLLIDSPTPGEPESYVLTASGWRVCGRVEP
jgi:hypothetical protein